MSRSPFPQGSSTTPLASSLHELPAGTWSWFPWRQALGYAQSTYVGLPEVRGLVKQTLEANLTPPNMTNQIQPNKLSSNNTEHPRIKSFKTDNTKEQRPVVGWVEVARKISRKEILNLFVGPSASRGQTLTGDTTSKTHSFCSLPRGVPHALIKTTIKHQGRRSAAARSAGLQG